MQPRRVGGSERRRNIWRSSESPVAGTGVNGVGAFNHRYRIGAAAVSVGIDLVDLTRYARVGRRAHVGDIEGRLAEPRGIREVRGTVGQDRGVVDQQLGR